MFSDTLHHAYIIEGNPTDLKSVLIPEIQKQLLLDEASQDLFLLETDMFSVEDASRVVEINSRKAFDKGKKGIVIIADTFSHQAQNALLKTLEEPTLGTHFFILTSTSSVFLPTILSRVQVIRRSTDTDNTLAEVCDVHGFLKGTPAERLLMVKQILKEKDDENISDRDIFVFVNELEKELFRVHKGTKKEINIAHVFTKVQDYIRDTSSSKKILLEYLALMI
ncbi:MAG: hypothetical protein FGM57_01390 [Candidatus Taylorbacteria bacterium]|nr:hypothetical protein [Candidatus Taylorbacteria bacterium]